MKFAFLVVAARTCACWNWPLDAPPPPIPAPPPRPDPPPPGLLEGDAHGSVDGDELAVTVGLADALGDADASGVTDVVGVGDTAPDRPERAFDIPGSSRKPRDDAVFEVGEAGGGGDGDDAGNSPLVRSHTNDCSEGAPPEVDDEDGVGVGAEDGPGLDAAVATAAGVNITVIAAVRPIRARFISQPPAPTAFT